MKTAEEFYTQFEKFKATEISGRYLSRKELEDQLRNLKEDFIIEEAGRSFLNLPIDTIKIGKGPVKILAWSQMHGNETTTTKGLLDVLNFFRINKERSELEEILQKITLLIIPMLNPDGAARYTRENVNEVDLNRDAVTLKEPESKVLRKCFESFAPHFCFNLHDQRTIFGAGEEPYPATLSFLAPSLDVQRTITPSREKAMQVIAVMNESLQQLIPKRVGRFDDSFNLNCSGDYFQSKGVPTILFECGHSPDDYQREQTRRYFGFALMTAIETIASGAYVHQDHTEYFKIPENKKSFYDIILRNAVVAGEIVDVAIQYSEKVKAGEVRFIPIIETMAPKLNFFGHLEIDCKEGEVKNLEGETLSENDIVEAILLNSEKLLIKSPHIP